MSAAVIREVHLSIEVRQVALARPVADLVVASVGSSVAVRSVAVVVLQEFLVLAFEILFEDDAADLEIGMLVSEAGFLLTERRVEIRIVVDLAGAADAGVKRLLGPAVALQGVRVEQIASLFGESQAAFVTAKVDGLDKAFMEDPSRPVARSELAFTIQAEPTANSTIQQGDFFSFKGSQVAPTATMFLRTEPSLLDRFIAALPALDASDGGPAVLQCVPRPDGA